MTSTNSCAASYISGYTAQFVSPLLKRHECPICLCAMRNPVQTECEHLFCRACLEPVLEVPNPVCPVDKTSIYRSDVFSDNACRREILSLEVFCDAFNNGCPWTGTLKELEVHIESVCPEYLRPCPNVCVPTSQFKLHQLEAHLDLRFGGYPLAEVPCPFKPYGCTFVSERKKKLSHLDECKLQHAYLQTDYSKVMMEQVSKNTEAIEHLTGRVSAVEAHMDSILDGLRDGRWQT